MITLYPDQERSVAGLRGAFRGGFHSPLLVSPTGSGKTVMFSYLTGRLLEAKQRVSILAHREELLDQISRTLSAFDVEHGVISAGALYDRRLRAHVASVFTLNRRIERVAVPDYAIVDEAHHCINDSTWGKLITYWRERNPKLRVIGVTATPQRLSGEGLGETFDTMVLGPSVRELIDAARLSDYRLFAPSQLVDLTGVRSRGGDFARGELAGAMDKPAIIGNAVNEYRSKLDGAPAVAFCVSVEHAQHVAEQFRAQGYRSMSIDGKMEKHLRRDIVRDFSRGGINVLTSCDLISEGFDVPGIVGAILLRPTQSLALYLQQVGRALRTAPGKSHAIILDHVGNSLPTEQGGRGHGLPDDPRQWSLEGRKKKGKGDEETTPGCRQCEKCYAISPAAASRCRECGAEFPRKARTIEEVAGTLSEVDVARMKREAAKAQAAAQTLEDLIRLGTERGYSNPAGWARHVFDGRKRRQA